MCRFSEDGELNRAPSHSRTPLFGTTTATEKTYWSLLTDKQCNGQRISADPYGYIDGGFLPGDSYQYCCTSAVWKGTALPLLLWQPARAAFNDEGFITYVQRWVNFGAWAQPDPCAPPSGMCSDGSGPCTGTCQGSPCGKNGTCQLSMAGYGTTFGPDSARGGCILDKDPSDGVGRFPDRHGAGRDGGGYASRFAAAMWAAYANGTASSR